jgi:hypothetical protein
LDIKEVHSVGDQLFSKRTALMSDWQCLAELFWPTMATFTAGRTSFNDDTLMTSYTVLVRRDLGDSFDTMLRPTGQEWFHMGVQDEDFRGNNEAKRWLENAAGVQRRAMYDRVSQYTRAMKQGDHTFATFGQAPISVELNRRQDALLYRCWHLRDVAWGETEDGKTCPVFRKWKPTARDLIRLFGRDQCHEQVIKSYEKDPFTEVDCRHVVLESDMWSGDEGKRTPYVSIYYDCEHDNKVLEVRGVFNPIYVIPRWMSAPGSQYAYSPAAATAFNESRLLQAMTRTLLEAGEKAVNPPLIGVGEALRSDLNIFAGGFTNVDSEYDERLGEVLRPLTVDKSGIPLGIDMQRDSRQLISDAFYLNKISPPLLTTDPNMTAFQAGQIVQEYIRQATPLFAPMETEYNGQICEVTFDLLMRGGAFGSPLDIPRSLRGADIQFRFESPLHDAIEKQKVTKFMESKQLIAEAVALDPTAAAMVDTSTALRDCLQAIAPAKWVRSEQQMADIQMAEAEKRQSAELLANMQAGADVAKTGAEAMSLAAA